ncbi:gamma-glutamyl-gamma-aminobutyrate hydrolase family protein [candidate division WOR-3 bacterium]|nr:gamma-glutamyl-gamma-aminobutyrate hydrolase family protein [candidate division WOR-3 bacterium]
MTHKALVVDLSFDQDFYDMFKKELEGFVQPVYVNGFEMKYPSSDKFSLIVFSGSQHSIENDFKWLDYAMEYYLKCFENSVPVLGICFGHQLISRAHAGKDAVGKVKVPEMGFVEISQSRDCKVFEGLENPFRAIGAHYDEVKTLPKGFRIIAENQNCHVQAMINESKCVLGLQFHPEIDGKTAKKLFEKEVDKMRTYGVDLNKIIADTPDGRFGAERIFENFLQYFVM